MKSEYSDTGGIAILAVLLAAVLYGISAPVSKLLLAQLPPALMAALLYLGAGAGMLLFNSISRKKKADKAEAGIGKKDAIYVVGMIALDIAAPIFLIFGLNRTTAANASLLNNFGLYYAVLYFFTFLCVIRPNKEEYGMSLTEAQIKSIFLAAGADLCGIANIDRFTEAPAGFHPADLYPSCRSVIVYARSLPAGLTQVSPRILYNRANNLILEEVDRIGIQACRVLEQQGGTAVPLPCDVPYDYWDAAKSEGRGTLSMRHAAVLAGLGSMGKSSMVLTRKYGNMICIGAVLTDLDLRSDPVSEDLCIEGCSLCVDSCPSHAIRDKTVDQSLCRPNTYGTNARGFSVVNCNLCRTVCPLSGGSRYDGGCNE